MVVGLFSNIQPLVKPKPKLEVPRPDNLVFRLHYKVTFALLCASCILVSSYAFIDSSGSAIQCMSDKKVNVPQEIINRYCWIMSTFTLPKHYEGVKGEEFIHYGVGPHSRDDEKVFHAYYQWVPMVLFMQGIMFYFPHWLWKQLDGGRIKNIIVGLNAFIQDEGARDQKIKSLADYMHMRAKLGGEHNKWAGKFFFCECLNFVNVIWQIIFTDIFLDGEFSQFGTEVIKFSNMEPEDRVDPMSRVFPRMTKCIFQKFGGSGTIQKFDSLCVLSMNILNEKIYIFLWFWFIILAIITGINIVVRIFQMCSSTARNRFIKLESRGYLGTAVDRNDVHAVVKDLNYSDWLIFYFLAQSMDQRNFGQLVKHMAKTPDKYNSKRYADQRQGNGDQEMQPLADAERGAGGNNSNGDDGGDGGDKIYPNLG